MSSGKAVCTDCEGRNEPFFCVISKDGSARVGYQHYAYREKPPFNAGQDYRAHLPYTSLRVYFGGRE